MVVGKQYQICLSKPDLSEALISLLKTISQADRYPLGCLLSLSTLEISQHEAATQEIIRMAHGQMHMTLTNRLKYSGIADANEKAQILCIIINGLLIINKAGKPISDQTIHELLAFLK